MKSMFDRARLGYFFCRNAQIRAMDHPAPSTGSPGEGSGGQATKGIRWMPWRQEVMKDVVSCDKPRGAETSVDPWISEWENPHRVMSVYPMAEYIGRGTRTGRTETS